MKHVTLYCKTQGFGFGAIVPVGDGEGEISLEIVEGLVADGLAKEYDAPVVTGQVDTSALDAEISQLKDQVETLTTERDNALTELELAKGASDGKANTTKK